MAFSTGSSGHAAEINVTPLVDVLLVLLIIFMVIGPKLPHGVDSSIPQKSEHEAAEAEQPVTVHVLAGAPGAAGVRYKVGGQETTLAELGPVLQRLFRNRPEGSAGRSMFVDADRALSYRDVAQVAAAGRAAGAGAIGLMGGEPR